MPIEIGGADSNEERPHGDRARSPKMDGCESEGNEDEGSRPKTSKDVEDFRSIELEHSEEQL
jgi:hypothetical protein